MINNLGEFKSPIINNSSLGKKYSGDFINLGLEYVGLEQGIKNTYNRLRNLHD